MPTIDSDAHVVETEQTWDFIDPSDSHLRPIIVSPKDGGGQSYWFVDGKTRGLARGAIAAKGLSNKVTRKMDTPVAAREMEDIPARLAHMDELGIDVQVLYPTIYINRACDREATDVALARAYNRWLASIWKQAPTRLRWACVLPLSVIEEAIAELRFSVENGACAVMVRGIEGDRLLCDPYFFPIYEEAARLNVPIGVHIGNSNNEMNDILVNDGAGGTFSRLRLMSVAAFHALVMTGVPKMFPNLRFAFLEASAQWVPYVLHDLVRRFDTRGKQLDTPVLENYKIWVSCQTDDDLPYVLKYAGEEHIVTGTDYGHSDQSSEIEALRNLRAKGEIGPGVADKILFDNPKVLYNLDV